jgi:hypothetical protein
MRLSDPDLTALGSPILVPAFPRDTQALDRDTLLARDVPLQRIDLQLIAMISDAHQRLAKRGLRVKAKVFMWGYSAAGTFTSRFVALHPQMIQSLRKAPLQIFRGDQDTNDEVAYDDGYDPADRELINSIIAGPPPINRYPVIESIYRNFGSPAEFVIEKGMDTATPGLAAIAQSSSTSTVAKRSG